MSINLLADIGRPIGREEIKFRRRGVRNLLQRHPNAFPGVQPVSFLRRHFAELQDNDYFLIEKSDGVSCMLYLTEDIGKDGQRLQCQFLIDRRNHYYKLEHGCLLIPPGTKRSYDTESNHNGTLLDGEVVSRRRYEDKSGYKLLVFDCLALNGANVTRYDFLVRRRRMETEVFTPLQAFYKDFPEVNDAQLFQIELKHAMPSYRISKVLKEKMPGLPHRNDGLIFVCKRSPYMSGTDHSLLKWKALRDNTIDFRLCRCTRTNSPSVQTSVQDGEKSCKFQLQVLHDNHRYYYFADMHMSALELRSLNSSGKLLDKTIVECFWDETGGWRPKLFENGALRIRYDKANGNHVSVVRDILESIHDAVTETELIEHIESSQLSWEKRNAAPAWDR